VLDDTQLQNRYGAKAARAYIQAEIDAIDLVDTLINRLTLQVDRHSSGETVLAHSPRALKTLRKHADQGARWISREAMPGEGLNGPFFGAVTGAHGFALNPRKYLAGLAEAAQAAGARLFQNTPASAIRPGLVTTPGARISAKDILIATNGYSSDDLPAALSARYLPVQSNVLVTAPLSDDDLAAQGWFSDQMCYDTRGLLHYFRLMPDRRFLFGMRGGLTSSPKAEVKARAKTLRDFRAMFPHWTHVEATHLWSGLACLSAAGRPIVGPLPESKRIFTAMAYHGNGVAMGTYCGTLIARLLTDQDVVPDVMRTMPRFPLGRFRRMLLPPLYFAQALIDKL
jgi:glycine/D-amino acid oxidase-like deaminating enzyme